MSIDVSNYLLNSFDDYNNKDGQIKSKMNKMGFVEANTQTFSTEDKNFNDWGKKDKELIYKDVNISHSNRDLNTLDTSLPKENRKYCILSGNERKVRAWGVK